jgi:hypothetical protein
VDVRTIHRAAARMARTLTVQAWPAGWYSSLMGTRLPPPVTVGDRATAVDVHQLRAGHWSGSNQWRHRIGHAPSRLCEQCNDHNCPAALCSVCQEEADTPRHILLRCPALMHSRLRLLGSMCPSEEDVRSSDVIAALVTAYRSLQSRSATSP